MKYENSDWREHKKFILETLKQIESNLDKHEKITNGLIKSLNEVKIGEAVNKTKIKMWGLFFGIIGSALFQIIALIVTPIIKSIIKK